MHSKAFRELIFQDFGPDRLESIIFDIIEKKSIIDEKKNIIEKKSIM